MARLRDRAGPLSGKEGGRGRGSERLKEAEP